MHTCGLPVGTGVRTVPLASAREGDRLRSPEEGSDVPPREQITRARIGSVAPLHRRGATLAILAAVVVLSGCLGPTEHDPTGTAPIGTLDRSYADGASIRLVGWALDPDTRQPVDVVVSVEQQTTTHRADRPRPDVAAVHRTHGPNHGFDIRTRPLPPGVNQACIWVPNVGRGTRDRLLGCVDVRTGTDDPVGQFEALEVVDATTIRARGWAYDPDAGGPAQVAPQLNGSPWPARSANLVHAEAVRAVTTPGRHGFSIDFSVAPGDHRVCLTARNVGRGSDRDLGCRELRLNSTPVLAPGAGIDSLGIVGPPPAHPLELIDRDAGVSVGLSDGSRLWLFGDSSELDAQGRLRYFVNNTAAWSSADAPDRTLDAVEQPTRPVRFVAPTEPFSEPCPIGYSSVMWPLSAVAVPLEHSVDRVLAYVGNVCLSGQRSLSRGVALVEWRYDAAEQHQGQEIRATVLTQNLFPTAEEYGTASSLHEGLVHVYRCGRPSDERPAGTIVWPDDPAYSGCTVARVAPEHAEDPDAYRYWAGGDQWVPDRSLAETMQMPADPTGHRRTPVAAFSVTDDPHHGWTMVYSPWPGFTNEVAVRSAPGPTGPWSEWHLTTTPGCVEWADGSERLCYAATAQPWVSTPTQLGIGYYDMLVGLQPTRGAYLWATTPFVARSSG